MTDDRHIKVGSVAQYNNSFYLLLIVATLSEEERSEAN